MVFKNSFIVLLLAVAGLFCSCGDGNNYTLTGSLPTRYDGCRVLLSPATYYFSSDKSIPVDSGIIKNGEFRFRGTVQEPAVFVLTIEDVRDNRIPGIYSVPVIIESGNIRVLYDTTGITLSGTLANDRYMATIGKGKQEIQRRSQILFRERDSVQQLAGNVSNEINNYYNEQSRIIFREIMVPAAEEFISEYAGTSTGDYFFFTCCSKDIYSDAFVERIYPTINPELREQYETFIRTRQEKQNYFSSSQKATEVGRPFREIVARTIEGKEVRLSEQVKKGGLVLLDFWGSWCVPCIQEMPLLKELHEKYGKKGLVIIGISLDKEREKWQSSLEKHKPIGIQISELKGWESASRNDYGVQAIPFTLLIDGSGKIIARNPHGPKLVEAVEEYFNRK